jgi:small subunit ribosomal protein S6
LLRPARARLDIQKEDDLAEKRVYEVVFIIDPDTAEEDAKRLVEGFQQIATDQGGNVVKNELMGRRPLAYRIGRKTEGVYILFEIEGTGKEIAELERRMRVSDQVLRYLTVRVDEDRQRAEKLRAKRAKRAAKRGGFAAGAGASAGGVGARGAGRETAAREEEE